MTSPAGPVVMYDDRCGFCSRSVRFLLRHDRAGLLRFAGVHGEYALAVRSRHPEWNPDESMAWLEPAGALAPERLLTHSDAVLRAAAYLGGPWRLATIARILPRPWRDAAYRTIARHRHHLPRPAAPCPVPDENQRRRFLS